MLYICNTHGISLGCLVSKCNQPFARNIEGVFEAEDAKFKGPSRSNKVGGFMGKGYVDFGSKKGEYVEWDVTIRQDGPHTLRFRYASADSRPLRLSVDSKEDLLAPPLPFASTRMPASASCSRSAASGISGTFFLNVTSTSIQRGVSGVDLGS